ncbi:F-box domain-containing protein [Apiospora arundinis]|uniref:F-box domain-containing protein n=1 Tax=Apiospora arundinis TaxID=335852 RepID=A0ABR2HSJ9_9PEZI
MSTGPSAGRQGLVTGARYAGINPEFEDSVSAVNKVSNDGLHYPASNHYSTPTATTSQEATVDTTMLEPQLKPGNGDVLLLPPELIDSILSFLSPVELAAATQVCRKFHSHADADVHWQRHVQANVPGNVITSPYPFDSFRELYVSHDPYWFIPRNKIWFSDRSLPGQMIIVQYDQRRGVIEGYQMLAVSSRADNEAWLADATVFIHNFEPKVRLHRDKPVVKFSPLGRVNLVRSESGSSSFAPKHQFFSEQQMHMSQGSDPRLSNIILAKELTPDMLRTVMDDEWPYGFVWPPPTIPTSHRVGARASGILSVQPQRSTSPSSPSIWKPSSRSEISEQCFRLRQWMEMGPPTLGVHLGEELVTYSTLDPKLYTPTKEKPWRGIWVGDYSGHGCEFLLLHQPDVEGETGVPLERREGETDAQYDERFLEERVYKGRLEAIKLTGDPNVPRGEYTFIAPDLSEAGILDVAQEPPFQGVRIVQSTGHIAHTGFYNDKYIYSKLILISHNRLAQYWVDFGHISFFERVDVDSFLKA